MTKAAQDLLNAFVALSPAEQHEVTVAILRQTAPREDLPESAFDQIAAELFREYDSEEAVGGSPLHGARGENGRRVVTGRSTLELNGWLNNPAVRISDPTTPKTLCVLVCALRSYLKTHPGAAHLQQT